MEKISSLRKKIDEIDDQILRFLKERVDVCENIGLIKQEQGIPVKDSQRESEQYTRIARIASKLGLNPQEVRAVYQEIIAMSIRAQERESYRT
ncbi:MAG: chorismate mutase [Candidatus Bathyarchaeota archaeon]|nr:MAG: chorismate mutase [Candidatus Bathyarchaeota archaeon]